MKPYKKSVIAKTTMYRKEYKIATNEDYYFWYWEGMVRSYPRYRRGYKNPHKYLMSYQVRMYKTWKHNRKTQWK
jgi:hypothetical protein